MVLGEGCPCGIFQKIFPEFFLTGLAVSEGAL